MAGGMQMTGGNISMGEPWDEIRRAGATPRAMLVEAAAREWGGPASQITVDGGVVSHSGSGRRAPGIPQGASVSSLACWRE
jgi:isoquinoline 1-oxidoreductase subunit beta